MNYIVPVEELYDEKDGRIFGYVGKDLNTGKIRYFYFDNNILQEFDPNNISDEYLRTLIARNSGYIRKTFNKKQLVVVKSSIENALNTHLEYNLQNNYPVDNLITNRDTLKFYPRFFGDTSFYSILENAFHFRIPSHYEFDDFGEVVKNYLRVCTLHEAGHLKASSFIYDEKARVLISRNGFYKVSYNIRPIYLPTGEIFLFEKFYEDGTKESKILEEMINELECKRISSDYTCVYPKYGEVINNLCNRKLQSARYLENGMDIFYDEMSSIIPSISLANELLGMINESYYGEQKEKSIKDSQKLIREYVKKKK